MSTDPQTFRHRSEEIEAVQWTGDNADALRAFAGPDFDEIDLDDRTEDPDETAAVRESEHGTWRGLKPGDWVVRLDGGLYEFAADDFAKQYEPAPAAPVAAPPTGQAGLRGRIIEALSEVRRPGLGAMTEADAVAYMADAVLSVLPVTAGQADRAAADLTTARATNQRLHLRAQQLESELAAYRRAVADWEITDTSTYVPLRTLAVIAKAAGISVPDRWELHYQRVERAEADRAAVAELAQAIRLTREYVGADLLPAVEGWSWYDALRRHAPHELPADDASRMAAVPAGSADAGHSGGETQPRRGDQFESWLKAQRDLCFDYPSAWGSVDGLLDRYRLHADTGTPLGEHVCESRMVGDCDCLETEPAAGQSAGGTPQPKEARP